MSAEGADPAHPRFSAEGEQTLQCAILFLDLVGYSARPVDDQVVIKKRLNLLLKGVLRDAPPQQWLAIDTGDGAAVCFLGPPRIALESAMLLRHMLAQRYGRTLSLRIGLHLGPVRVVPDVNGSLNVVGDGINTAQRIMDFALPNEVLLSRAFHDAATQGALPPACEFREAGLHHDKHGREHVVYRLQDVSPRASEPAAGYARGPLPGPVAAALERALTRHIGPMARLLMEQALASTKPVAALPQSLAAHIQHAAQRDAFLEEARQILSGAVREPLSPPPDPPRP